MDDLKPIFDLAIDYDPGIGLTSFRDVHTPRMWVNSGCSVAQDIVPALTEGFEKVRKIETARGRRNTVKAFAYFTNQVELARDRRLARELAQRPEAEDPEREGRLMKSLAWLRAKKPELLMPEQKHKLERYEEKNGPVMA